WLPPLSNIEKWWDTAALGALSRMWSTIRAQQAHMPDAAGWLLTVAFLRASIRSAHVSFGHQSMSFKQRKTNGASQTTIDVGFLPLDEWTAAITSILDAAASPILAEPREILCDARALTASLERGAYAAVITSPPYCNRMSYIRELRPYMYW